MKLKIDRHGRPDLRTWTKLFRNYFSQDFDYGETHNWKSIVLSLLVIGFVIAGIVTAIYLLG